MINFKKTANLAPLILLAIALTACGSAGVEVSSRFDNSQNIEEGAAIFFKGELAGEVSEVVQDGSSSVVVMHIEPEQAELISKGAAVVVNSLKQGTPLEIHNSANPKVLGLEHGDQLDGLDSMMSLIGWSVGDALDFGGSELSGYLRSFQEYLESDEFASDKGEIKSHIESAANDAASALKDVENEITATINGHDLTEQELAAAMEQLGRELSPVVEEAAASGARIMQELERFAQSLEAHSEEHQESGVQFLDSLSAVLEKLNESMEKGLERGLEDKTGEHESAK